MFFARYIMAGLAVLALVGSTIVRANEPPRVENVTARVDREASRVAISYDLVDIDDTSATVFLLISTDGGHLFDFSPKRVTGAIGPNISGGVALEIFWDFTELPGAIGQGAVELAFEVVADDGRETEIAKILELVDEERIRADLEMLEGTRHYGVAAENIEAAKDQIESVFRERGLRVTRQPFRHNQWSAENIIGTRPGIGMERTVVALDAHFDTVPTTPGVDDNATGVAGMLEAARVLSQFRFAKSIRFLGFDLEEVGLIGSRNYVATGISDKEQFEAVLNFEMIGYTCMSPGCDSFAPVGDYIHNIGDEQSVWLRDRFASVAKRYVPELALLTTLATPDNPNFRRSDHARFWDAGIPALFLTDGANFRNPHYHQPSDIVGTLDLEFLVRVVQVTIGTLAELAEPLHAGLGISNTVTLDLTPVRKSSWGSLKRSLGSY